MSLGPRVVIAGTHSGVGKTTISTGVMAALRSRGTRVRGAKVGPDYIDPGYHALATGAPGRNLDPWMSGAGAIAPLAGRAARGGEILVVEGVMGLFDGARDGEPASTADVAALLDAPVVLVVDASGMSDSIAALARGFATFDPRVTIAGVILNRVGSGEHVAWLRRALEPVGIPVLGALPRSATLSWRERHLGLVPVVEDPASVARALDALATTACDHLDLDALVGVARQAPSISVDEPPMPTRVANVVVAVAAGRAFSFMYPDNLEALEAAGATLIPFDPTTDSHLPDRCDAIVVGGGFPEVYAADLAENTTLLADVRRRCADGTPVWAECAGLLWLANQCDGRAMAGVVPTTATMTDRLTLGYRSVRTATASPIGPAGLELRGHEFHYTTVSPEGDGLPSARSDGPRVAGWTSPDLFASYLHLHLGATPALAAELVTSAARTARRAARQ